jgi:hypothetical protein
MSLSSYQICYNLFSRRAKAGHEVHRYASIYVGDHFPVQGLTKLDLEHQVKR